MLEKAPLPPVACSYRNEGLGGALDLRRPSLSSITLPPAQILVEKKNPLTSAPLLLQWFLNHADRGCGFHTAFPPRGGSEDKASAKKPRVAPSADVIYQTTSSSTATELLSPPPLGSSRTLVSQTFVVYNVTTTNGAAESSGGEGGSVKSTNNVSCETVITLTLNRRCTSHLTTLIAATAHDDDEHSPVGTGSTVLAAPASRSSSLSCVYEPVALLGLHGGDILVISLSQEKCLQRFNSSYTSSSTSSSPLQPQAISGSAVATIAELQSSSQQCIARSEIFFRSTETLTDAGIPLQTAARQDGALFESSAVFAAGFDNGQILLFSVSAERGAVLRVLNAVGSSPIMTIAVLGLLNVFSFVETPPPSTAANTAMLPQLRVLANADTMLSPLAVPTLAAVSCKRGDIVLVDVETFAPCGGVVNTQFNKSAVHLGEIHQLCWLHEQATEAEWLLAACGEDDRISVFGVRKVSHQSMDASGHPVPSLDSRTSPQSADSAGQPQPSQLVGTLLHRLDRHRSWTCSLAEWRFGWPAGQLPSSAVTALVCCSYDRTWSLWYEKPNNSSSSLTPPPQNSSFYVLGGRADVTSSFSASRRMSVSSSRTPQGLKPRLASDFSRASVILDEPLFVLQDTCGQDDMVLRCAAITDTTSANRRQMLVTLTHKCRLSLWIPHFVGPTKPEPIAR